MAKAKHSGLSADSQVTRRNILRAAPAAGMAAMLSGALPAEAKAETPIIALYRRYRAITDAADDYKPDDLSVTDEEMDQLFYNERDDIERELMAHPCETPADFAAKMIVATRDGGVYVDWYKGDIWAEARALVGG